MNDQLIITFTKTPGPTAIPFYSSNLAIFVYLLLAIFFILVVIWLIKFICAKFEENRNYYIQKSYSSDEAINYSSDGNNDEENASFEEGPETQNQNIEIISYGKEETQQNQDNIEKPLIKESL